jgi:hypothetical protein
MSRWLFLSVLLLCLVPLSASAHRLDESYVYFNVTDDTLAGRFEATVADLSRALALDDDGDGEITEEELQRNAGPIFEFFEARLVISAGGRTQPIAFDQLTTLDTLQGVFVQVGFAVPGVTETPRSIDLDYEPLADVLGAGHRGFVLIESNTRTGLVDNEAYVSLAFDAGDGVQTLSLEGEPLDKLFFDFVEYGVWHVWLGFEHLVFMAVLLVSAVMTPRDGRWVPQDGFQPAFWRAIGIVCVLTLCHFVALGVVAFGNLQLPLALLDVGLAIAIVAVAAANLIVSWHAPVLWAAIVFGALHGLGSGWAMAPLGAVPAQVAIGLLAFDLGMLAGLVAIVTFGFPILWALRRRSLYRPAALGVGSAAAIGLASLWLLERTTDFEWNIRGTIDAIAGLVS